MCSKVSRLYTDLQFHCRNVSNAGASGYSCNTETEDQRYATSHYGAQILSAPAFEIRWHQADLGSDSSQASASKDVSTRLVPGDHFLTTPSSTMGAHHTTKKTETTMPSSIETPSKPSDHTDLPASPGSSVSSPSIVGIAIGSTFAILAMAFTIIFFILRRRRSREDRLARFSNDFRNQGYPDVGLVAGGRQMPTELDSSPVEPKELAADTEQDSTRRSFPHPFRNRTKHVSINGPLVELPA